MWKLISLKYVIRNPAQWSMTSHAVYMLMEHVWK